MSRFSSSNIGLYERTVITLAKHRVEYVICGGVASVLHGVPRVTADIDLVVRMTNENLERFVAAVSELEVKPRAPVPIDAICDAEQRRQWTEQKGAKVMTYVSLTSPLQIDVLLEYPIDFESLYEQASVGELEGVQFRISSIAHLIRVKQSIRPIRDNDQFDLKHLERMLEHESDPPQS